jgi:ATP-dependent DNA helicase RecG
MAERDNAVRALLGPLDVETREGYPDAAVIGESIGSYVRVWAEKAKRSCSTSRETGIISRIVRVLDGYDEGDPQARAACVEQARELLGQLRDEAAGGPGQPSGTSAQPTKSSSKKPSARIRKPSRSAGQPAATETLLEQIGPAGYLDGDWVQPRYRRSAWVGKLKTLGLETRRDLLYHFPRDYVTVKRVDELVDGERAAVLVTAGLREETVTRERRGFRLMRYALEVSDETGKAWVSSFARVPRRGRRAAAISGSPIALNFPQGSRLLIEGAVRRAGRLIEIQYGDSERISDATGVQPGTLAPVYPLTDGVYQGPLRRASREALAGLPENLTDSLPAQLRVRYGLAGLREALWGIHWPSSEKDQQAAQRRLAFEEFLTLQLALAQRKRETERPGSGLRMAPRGDMVAQLEEILPFSLTRAQQRAIAEIVSDMAMDRPMSRMIQGDVGSGKTVVAAAALLTAIQSSYQGALMAPTELLAEQHYLVLTRMLKPLGVRIELLTGSLKESERDHALAYIADGRAQLVVGTHALIQEGVAFHNLGAVVVDEQHRFGVKQRAALRGKGGEPDLLVMTATPIPRSLALTLYGDLELSVLDELPPGRTPVQTSWLPMHRIEEAYRFVRGQVEQGRQVYIVCPLVEESEKLQAEAATQLADDLITSVFPDLTIGLLHGALPVAEKDAVMEAFRRGDTEVLCATTVIEVGVDVPNATAMLILNAERFGLAQLHQLRGRVGRSEHESHCLLVTARKYNPVGRLASGDEDIGQARGRLKVMLNTTDGFRIAEEDLLLRGPGEFYGTRQHGMPDFRLARMVRDLGLLEEAREAAAGLIEQDPSLQHAGHEALRERVVALRTRMDEVAG